MQQVRTKMEAKIDVLAKLSTQVGSGENSRKRKHPAAPVSNAAVAAVASLSSYSPVHHKRA